MLSLYTLQSRYEISDRAYLRARCASAAAVSLGFGAVSGTGVEPFQIILSYTIHTPDIVDFFAE